MERLRFRSMLLLWLSLLLLVIGTGPVIGQPQAQNTNHQTDQQTDQQIGPPLSARLNQERLAALPALRNQLSQPQLRERTDLVIVINQALFNKVLGELTETQFDAGNLFKVTITDPQVTIENGLAYAHMQAQLASSNALINLTNKLAITARLLVEQNEENALIAKLQVVELQPINRTDQTALPTTITPEQLSNLLPPLKLPLELNFDHTFQPATIKQSKPIGYEVSSESRRIRGNVQVTTLLPLTGRLAIFARVRNLSISNDAQEKPPQPRRRRTAELMHPTELTSAMIQQCNYQTGRANHDLDREIDQLSSDLSSEKDLSVTLDRRFLSDLTEQFAKASPRDLLIKVLPSRVLSTKSDLGFAKYENYLDIQGGNGVVDLREATVTGIKNGRIHLMVDAAGLVQAQAQGKQIGFSYAANPQIGISMHDSIAFVIEPAGQDFRLRPLSKRLTVHLDIDVAVPTLGTGVNASQDLPFDIALVMQPMTLPRVISTQLKLPRGTRSIVLNNTGYRAEDGKLQFEADLDFQGP